jgi:hypothetical protein
VKDDIKPTCLSPIIRFAATAQSKAGFFRGYVVAEAPPGFQAGWSECMYFSLSFFVSFAHLEFRVSFVLFLSILLNGSEIRC